VRRLIYNTRYTIIATSAWKAASTYVLNAIMQAKAVSTGMALAALLSFAIDLKLLQALSMWIWTLLTSCRPENTSKALQFWNKACSATAVKRLPMRAIGIATHATTVLGASAMPVFNKASTVLIH